MCPHDELGTHTGFVESRNAAEKYAGENLQGKSFVNAETGKTIKISRSGIKKILASSSADPDNLKRLPAAPKMIEQGKLIGSEPPAVPEFNTAAMHRFQVDVDVAGKLRTTNFVVKEDANGHWYYNHAFGPVRK